MALSVTPAAVSQCFALVSLCTSIADPNWIELWNASAPYSSTSLIYGVAFTLHAAQNLTDTGPLGGPQGPGMRLLYSLAALCYCAVLLSSISFLFDFLGASRTREGLSVVLHVSTAVLCLGSLCVAGACLCVVTRMLPVRGPWGGPALGESFFIAALALLFCVLAAAGSVWQCRRRGALASGYMAIEGGVSDLDTPPLLTEGEDGGGVFPDWSA
ncbi:uncharacterized protein [Lepisosteus oculatus]|uniref:uncharacterized protein n=1 Tax=Lepisosteus oculatus TaxID=7918 RepID=UPI003723F433